MSSAAQSYSVDDLAPKSAPQSYSIDDVAPPKASGPSRVIQFLGDTASKTAQNMNVENILHAVPGSAMEAKDKLQGIDWERAARDTAILGPAGMFALPFLRDTVEKVHQGDFSGALANVIPFLIPSGQEGAMASANRFAGTDAATALAGAAKGAATTPIRYGSLIPYGLGGEMLGAGWHAGVGAGAGIQLVRNAVTGAKAALAAKAAPLAETAAEVAPMAEGADPELLDGLSSYVSNGKEKSYAKASEETRALVDKMAPRMKPRDAPQQPKLQFSPGQPIQAPIKPVPNSEQAPLVATKTSPPLPKEETIKGQNELAVPLNKLPDQAEASTFMQKALKDPKLAKTMLDLLEAMKGSQ